MIITLTQFPLGEIRFNTNILETNIINLAVVVGVLVYFGGDILKSLLNNRRETILKSLRDADERYQKATDNLNKAKEQLEIAKLKAEEIRTQGFKTATQGVSHLLERLDEDINRLEEAQQATMDFQEEKALNQVYEQVSRLAFDQARKKLKKQLNPGVHNRIIDRKLKLLEEL